jgi:hypothetical protein
MRIPIRGQACADFVIMLSDVTDRLRHWKTSFPMQSTRYTPPLEPIRGWGGGPVPFAHERALERSRLPASAIALPPSQIRQRGRQNCSLEGFF